MRRAVVAVVGVPGVLVAAGHLLGALVSLALTAAFVAGYVLAWVRQERVVGRLLAALEGTSEANHQHRLVIAKFHRENRARFLAGARRYS